MACGSDLSYIEEIVAKKFISLSGSQGWDECASEVRLRTQITDTTIPSLGSGPKILSKIIISSHLRRYLAGIIAWSSPCVLTFGVWLRKRGKKCPTIIIHFSVSMYSNFHRSTFYHSNSML